MTVAFKGPLAVSCIPAPAKSGFKGVPNVTATHLECAGTPIGRAKVGEEKAGEEERGSQALRIEGVVMKTAITD
jgi:hypothetical protein